MLIYLVFLNFKSFLHPIERQSTLVKYLKVTLMGNVLRINIESLIRSKRGFEFEAVINKMYLIKHGSDGYQPTRERSDDGAEGLIRSSKTIIAAYGPDRYDEKKFFKKVDDDYDDFIKKWAADYPNWTMHFNGPLAPDQIRICEELKERAKKNDIETDLIIVKGIDQIMQYIADEMSSRQLRQLATYLGVPRELITFDQIRSIIDDLIQGIPIDLNSVDYKIEVSIVEKININYSDEDRDSAKEEYQDIVLNGTLKKIWNILATYENEQITILKLKVRRELDVINGTYKEKVNSLVAKYLDKYSNDNDAEFEYYIRALLVYCFEQCMIGKKTKSETEIQL